MYIVDIDKLITDEKCTLFRYINILISCISTSEVFSLIWGLNETDCNALGFWSYLGYMASVFELLPFSENNHQRVLDTVEHFVN